MKITKYIDTYVNIILNLIEHNTNKIWTTNLIKKEINSIVTDNKKLNNKQVGFILRAQKTIKVFRYNDRHNGVTEYIFVKRNRKLN